jgi:hypothetical protein
VRAQERVPAHPDRGRRGIDDGAILACSSRHLPAIRIGRGMTTNRYEFRVAGRLTERTKDAFVGMEVAEVPAETIIRGDVVDEAHLHGVLALLQTMGLRVVAMNEVPG